MSYGARCREIGRVVVRREERKSSNTIDFLKRSYSEMCTKQKMIPQLEEDLERVQKRMKACRGPGAIREYMELKEQTKQIQEKIDSYREGDETREFFERAKPLVMASDGTHRPTNTNVEQSLEAAAVSLFHANRGVPVFIQTDRCMYCGTDLQFRTDESLLVCPNPQCMRTQRFLQLATDHVDVDFVAQDTHANHTRSTFTGNVDNMTDAGSPFPKPDLFRKFLHQFSTDVPDPPQEVMETIMRELHKVHIHHSSKSQPTPIGTILRKQNLKDYAFMALRIHMMIKRRDNEPILSLSRDLIDRLVKRFELLVNAMKTSRSRSKKRVFNLKFLTKVFLVLENEHAKAELLENHKTRNVLRREDRRVGQACSTLALDKEMEEMGLSWKFFRSL